MSEGERELGEGAEHRVTPLELFFDLVLVFALTQVTRLLAADPTWGAVLRGMLLLAALWWAWNVYAWLTSAMDVDEGGVRLAMLAAMGAMHLFRRRTIGAVVLLVLIPVAVAIPALGSLTLVSAVCSLVVAYEAIRHRADRARVRHPELAG